MTDTTPQFTVWSVLGADGVTHGYYTHLDDQGDTPGARTGSIDCWQKNEPAAPEYSWQPIDGGWELLAGGYWTGVYLIEHTVHGRVEQPAPAVLSGRVLRDRIASALSGADEHSCQMQDGVDYPTLAAAVVGVLAADNRASVALAEVRRMCEMTIRASVRVQAIDQARDTLAIIDRIMADQHDDEGLSGPCDCGEGAVHYTAAECPAELRRLAAETGGE